MASITLQHLEFTYPSATDEVFRDLSLLLDGSWRTGVVGRNGQGKSTLLQLIAGALSPTAGRLEVDMPVRLFPGAAGDPEQSTLQVVRNQLAPFDAWEQGMQRLLAVGSEAALAEYAELQARYDAAGGYQVDAWIAREFAAMELDASLLARPFGELSGGEQTRSLIVALFLDGRTFPLIDEPTNHLDRQGRERLGAYLAGKRGFLLVSHDRRLLDAAVDHVLSINRSDVRINRGTYSQWRTHMDEELAAERRTRARIEKDVARLQTAARETRSNATSRESDKYGTGAFDKGFIGHRAAKQMQRARNVERRIEVELEEKRALLGNEEKERRLKVATQERRDAQLLVAQNLTIEIGGRVLFENLSFAVAPGDRVAIVGPNGCGKTTLLNVLCGALEPTAGVLNKPGHVTLARSYQQPLWQRGRLRDRLAEADLEETRFRQLLGVVGVGAEAFERDLATFSFGQRKKVDLARTLLAPADVLIWDEPLNYVDLYSREQIEAAVLADSPTLVFVEHDQTFVERVATHVVDLSTKSI